MGMNIKTTSDNEIRLSVYDKRKDFPFSVVRYPMLKSEIPTNIPYGVFTGLLHRFFKICSEKTNFVDQALTLASTLYKN